MHRSAGSSADQRLSFRYIDSATPQNLKTMTTFCGLQTGYADRVENSEDAAQITAFYQ